MFYDIELALKKFDCYTDFFVLKKTLCTDFLLFSDKKDVISA